MPTCRRPPAAVGQDEAPPVTDLPPAALTTGNAGSRKKVRRNMRYSSGRRDAAANSGVVERVGTMKKIMLVFGLRQEASTARRDSVCGGKVTGCGGGGCPALISETSVDNTIEDVPYRANS